MAWLLTHFRIGSRIWAGFAILIAITACLIGYDANRFGQIRNQDGVMGALAANTNRVLRATRRLTEMRRAARSYISTADEVNERDFAEAHAALVDLLKEAANATLSEEQRQTYNAVREKTDALNTQFLELVRVGWQVAADRTKLFIGGDALTAARAGDAGKGFAVVASEVKALANQTAKATEDISQQITQIQTATQEAVTSIQNIGTTIGEVSEIAASIAAAVEEQGAATQEIARNVQQAAAGTTEVTSNIIRVNEGASSTGAAASQVLGAAGELSRQAAQLSSETTQFIAGVRAA